MQNNVKIQKVKNHSILELWKIKLSQASQLKYKIKLAFLEKQQHKFQMDSKWFHNDYGKESSTWIQFQHVISN